MSGLLANLVGAATAALNLRPHEPAVRAPKETGSDTGFASALSTALAPRQRSADAPRADEARAEESARRESETSAAEAEEATAAAAAAKAAAKKEADEPESDVAPEVDDASAVRSAEGPGPAREAPVTRSLDGLNPEFRERLERVIARMGAEYGHDVRIVETLRDQLRQDYLYAQGRTRPGPVVTWTRNSNHLSGNAADLLIDGTYDNPLAMVRLARIAREEGLRTLGSRDPGHIELPGGVHMESLAVSTEGTSELLDGAAARTAEATRSALVNRTDSHGTGGIAQVASVARVASVAEVAQVATVARVATPDAPGTGAREGAVAAPALAASAGQATAVAEGHAGGEGSQASGDQGRREGRQSDAEATTDPRADAASRLAAANHTGTESRTGAMTPELRGASGSFGAEAAERIARVLQLQDTSSNRPLSQMVLRLDNSMGGEDRIRVDLRGSAVGASLDVSDPVTAGRLQSELGQLQKALEGRGLQAEHLSVSGVLPSRDLSEALRTVLPGDHGRASQDSPGQREGWNGRSGNRQQGSDSEQPRQQPRRDTKQERNT